MSSETFTTALFLITAVVAAGVLINAVFPVVYTMSGTFSSSSHSADVRLRTDFVIVTTYANANEVKVWMKNVGSYKIANAELQKSDVYSGDATNFDRLTLNHGGSLSAGQWDFWANGTSTADWGPGDTLYVDAFPSHMPSSAGQDVYFQFVLPNGISRSITFTRI
jgi:flagellar protein FlaG